MRKRTAIVIATAAVGAFGVLGAQSAVADTIGVTNTNDSGAGSLRAAINRTNQLAGPDRILIDATGTIPLQSGLPTVTGTPLEIRGPGPSSLSLDASALTQQRDTVLDVDPANQCIPSSRCHVSLRGVSIHHAYVAAIRNNGVLDLIDSRVSDTTYYGVVNGRRLRVIDSRVSHNRYGIAGTSAENHIEVLRSTLRGNSTGIVDGGTLNVSASTLIGSRRYGIRNDYGQAVIRRSTLGGSRITNDFGGYVWVDQSTLSGERDQPLISTYDGSTSLKSTIVANRGGAACSGPTPTISQGFNLADDGSCNLTEQSDQPNTDPLLRLLGNYGGPTKTFALPKTSPAIDAGSAFGSTTDQRGLPRMVDYPGVPTPPGGDDSDIGAFELQAP